MWSSCTTKRVVAGASCSITSCLFRRVQQPHPGDSHLLSSAQVMATDIGATPQAQPLHLRKPHMKGRSQMPEVMLRFCPHCRTCDANQVKHGSWHNFMRAMQQERDAKDRPLLCLKYSQLREMPEHFYGNSLHACLARDSLVDSSFDPPKSQDVCKKLAFSRPGLSQGQHAQEGPSHMQSSRSPPSCNPAGKGRLQSYLTKCLHVMSILLPEDWLS